MNRVVRQVALLIVLLVCAAGAWSLARASASAAAQVKKQGRKGQAVAVEGVYKQNCARCHGADGRGETTLGKIYKAPDLTDPELHSRFSNKELSAIITSGQGGMPGFRKNLSKAEIAALVIYVRRFKK
ncbi:MAG TPA: cytochrome c [Pyrinomonadaceae bacterium]|jgi:mono/diheme cytochrome c family protein